LTETTAQEGQIASLADKRALDFLSMEPEVQGFNPGTFEYRMKQAILGFRYKREIELKRRTERDQAIRVVRMVFETPEKRRDYINQSMPALLPAVVKAKK